MLEEYPKVKQVPGYRRRWYSDDYLDLIVWYDSTSDQLAERIIGFQLCYDKGGIQRALTWREDEGFRHDAVDEGDEPAGRKKSPVLVDDGIMPVEHVIEEFEHRGANLDNATRELVGKKLREYNGGDART